MPMLSASADIWFVHLGIKLHNMAKSFTVFGYEIYFYGCIIAFSMLLGLFLACHVAKKTGQSEDTYLSLVIYGVIFGIIGARAYYVAFAWDYYKANPDQILNIRGGGLAIYGGVIAATLTAYVFCRIKKLSFRLIMDTACVGLITGQCTGRWSNFVNMEAFGRYTDGPLAMALNVDKVNPSMITQELLDKSFVVDGIKYIQVHPTFLYESLWSLMTLCILLFMTKRKKFDGQIFLLYLIIYGTGRFWIEGLRTDQLIIGHTGLAVSQVLSAALVVICLGILAFGLKRSKAAFLAAENEPLPEIIPEETKAEETAAAAEESAEEAVKAEEAAEAAEETVKAAEETAGEAAEAAEKAKKD